MIESIKNRSKSDRMMEFADNNIKNSINVIPVLTNREENMNLLSGKTGSKKDPN